MKREYDDIEIWKPIEGFEGFYEVSSHGRVRSLDRETTKVWRGKIVPSRKKGRVLKPSTADRYAIVSLQTQENKVYRSVHRLVCIAFHGPAPEGKPEVGHRNGDGFDNHHSNLRWVSKVENAADKFIHHSIPMGETHANSVMTAEIAAAAFVRHWRLSEGRTKMVPFGTYARMSADFGVSPTALENLIHFKSWRHVTDPLMATLVGAANAA